MEVCLANQILARFIGRIYLHKYPGNLSVWVSLVAAMSKEKEQPVRHVAYTHVWMIVAMSDSWSNLEE
jgi:hypothetical protein